MMNALAYLACAVLTGLTLFQLALAFGAPIGRYAWGGSQAVLPTKLRLASLVSVLLYGVFAVIILGRADLIVTPLNYSAVSLAAWVLTGYFSLAVVMNGLSRSRLERNLMTPLCLVLALLVGLISLS